MNFTKMHGIGNDYVYINCLDGYPKQDLSELAIRLSDRHTGVGGDGIILICPSDCADFKMRIFNADGSEAMMCGNGIRCVGKYVRDHGLIDRDEVKVDTLSGIKILQLHRGEDGKVKTVTVDMGKPSLQARDSGVDVDGEFRDQPVKAAGREVRLTAVSVGNPHGVVMVDKLEDIPFEILGPALERHPMWSDRANIEFMERQGKDKLKVRVWERGSGETMACGTGACAVATAARALGLCGDDVDVALKGGTLHIHTDPDTGHVFMTGPAAEVFSGTTSEII